MNYMKIYILAAALIACICLMGCSDTPSSTLKKQQYTIINDNVKKVLGNEYESINFTIVQEGYTDTEKTGYAVKFTFDLNKPYLVFDGKKIPGELIFKKNKEEWECTFNSGNALGLFNLLKSN